MPLREKWVFTYAAQEIAEAAATKKKFHERRLEFWQTALEKVKSDLREDGIEVSESLSNTTSNAYRGPQVMVKAEYQKDLDECFRKIGEHRELIKSYGSYHCCLSKNPNQVMELDVADFNFFFGEVADKGESDV